MLILAILWWLLTNSTILVPTWCWVCWWIVLIIKIIYIIAEIIKSILIEIDRRQIKC